LEVILSQFDRNHDGAALGASHHVSLDDQRSVYPYTVQGGATIPDRSEQLRRQNMLNTTYLYLAVAVAACMGAAWWGSHTESFLRIFFEGGAFMWIGVMVVLNFVPVMALKVAEKTPRLAVPALALDGAVAGLALAPLVFIGLHLSGAGAENGQNLVSTACVVTGAIFAAITAYIHLNKTVIQPKGMIMAGMFGFAIVVIPLNMFMQSSLLSLVVSGVVGLMGAYQIAVTTSRIVNDRNFNSPAAGALILFAGVFNLFQAILHLLIAGGRD
jgi:modulator of FtsH protease